MTIPHPTHVTKPASLEVFETICINCGVVQSITDGWDSRAADPCPNPVEVGGKTLEEYKEGESRLRAAIKSLPFDFDGEE